MTRRAVVMICVVGICGLPMVVRAGELDPGRLFGVDAPRRAWMARSQQMWGKVVEVDVERRMMTLETREGRHTPQRPTFHVEDDAVIADAGQRLTLQELVIGKQVTVHYAVRGGRRNAHSIVAAEVPTRA